jgi:hypothetical protein
MNFKALLPQRIKAAETEAAQGCGQSDVLYESRVQVSHAAILAQAPGDDCAHVESVLRERGFDPDFAPHVARDGECELTGIDTDCCPCGRHE